MPSLNEKIEQLASEMSKLAIEMSDHKDEEYRKSGYELQVYATNVYYWSEYLEEK
jgi:hypothetical protein